MAAGREPLGNWVRRMLNGAANAPRPPRLESHAVMGNEVIDMHTHEVVRVLPGRSFRPDFKGGGKK